MFINEASKLSGATQRAIRLYESLGLLNVSRSGKYRVYNQENINMIKIIKQAQTLGITLSDMVALKSKQEDFDWKSVSKFLLQKQEEIEKNIKELELQKQRIKNYQISIDKCVQGLDSDL
ncbi:MerR family transcriptional regulator [Vibrio mangrovi]|uniref:HTH-type transcriptional regulator CueR n=1 Tax=Vibrio mangrovi TaxID=474394 RepID=A0A1Y6J2H6_9VIBR|nr:MerR family transcriptional regulator [Vibrio mangrovi]MDW6005276.1 MerR family transcriptional regulator [Vibrio mangrovi]SMS02902.1 HTH-type transcriptional regulator CueR [Vibrio mangrovi]